MQEELQEVEKRIGKGPQLMQNKDILRTYVTGLCIFKEQGVMI
jgi:hypothetical protein